MTVLEEIYQAVLTDPSDDVARLAYADALTETTATPECRRCEGRRVVPTYSPVRDTVCSNCGATLHVRADGAKWCPRCWWLRGAERTGYEPCPACHFTSPDLRQVRADLIQVQVELAGLCNTDRTCPRLDNYGRSPPRWKEGVCQCRGCVLVRRENDLWDSGFLPPDTPSNRSSARDAKVWEWFGKYFNNNRVTPTFTRGFVNRVSLPLVEFARDDYAVAKLIGQMCPVTSIRLSDRDPTVSDINFPGWYRRGVDDNIDADDVPPEIYKFVVQYPGRRPMTQGGAPWSPDQNWSEFDAADVAWAALDWAAAAYARTLAGYPVLAPTIAAGKDD